MRPHLDPDPFVDWLLLAVYVAAAVVIVLTWSTPV